MGSVIPLKKSANSAYLDLKNLIGNKLFKVEELIELKLNSEVDLIKKMSDHHLKKTKSFIDLRFRKVIWLRPWDA
jgi:hypothetical protein